MLIYFVDWFYFAIDYLFEIYIFLSVQEIDENLNFDEQILEAAKSITNAAGALISAATSAQKEIATQVKVRYIVLISIQVEIELY